MSSMLVVTIDKVRWYVAQPTGRDRLEDVFAYMTFPKEHRAELHSTNPIERLIGEIKRRTKVVGTFPNDEAIVRLVIAARTE
jgi:transposase-like protein